MRLPSEARPRTGDPHVGKEMLGLISLRFLDQSGHIDAFRSIVGEAPEARSFLSALPPAGRTSAPSPPDPQVRRPIQTKEVTRTYISCSASSCRERHVAASVTAPGSIRLRFWG
jgi:hypothetical protein